nr:MAG TPA: hypothetical protein [Caudoviricetes sp.]
MQLFYLWVNPTISNKQALRLVLFAPSSYSVAI